MDERANEEDTRSPALDLFGDVIEVAAEVTDLAGTAIEVVAAILPDF